jgi:hypothetical protein
MDFYGLTLGSALGAALTALGLLGATAGCSARDVASDPLAWTVGNWHGVRRSADDGEEAPMAVRVESLPDGGGQVEILRVEGASGPYVGFALRVKDAQGEWTMVYASSPGRPFARLEGQVGEGSSTWTSVTPGRTRESRLVSERVDRQRWRKTQQVSDDGGATWRVLFTDELERDGDDGVSGRSR